MIRDKSCTSPEERLTRYEELLAVVEHLARHGQPPPVTVTGTFRDHRIEAEIEGDGLFHWRGERFNSPSVAAGCIITALTGERTPGRTYMSINGWTFWSVGSDSGPDRSLSQIRDLACTR